MSSIKQYLDKSVWIIIAIIILGALFAGDPDIADAIIYHLTDGAMGGS